MNDACLCASFVFFNIKIMGRKEEIPDSTAIKLTEIDAIIKAEIVDYIQNLDTYSQEQIIETNEGKFNFGSIYVEFVLEDLSYTFKYIEGHNYEFTIDLSNLFYTFENN